MAEIFTNIVSFLTNFFDDKFVLFILMLSLLVFVHELGHYLAAVRLGVPVEEFAIGFPPRLAGAVQDKDRRWRFFLGNQVPPAAELGAESTVFSFNWIPIGGFVRPKGEEDPRVPGGLSAASKRVRFLVLVAGSTFNIIFAFIVLTGAFLTGWPEPRLDEVSIAAVVPGSPAELGGLMVEDRIVQLNDTLIVSRTTTAEGAVLNAQAQVSAFISAHEGQVVTFIVQRGTARVTLPIQLRTRATTPEGQGLTGIQLGAPYDLQTYSFPEALYRAGAEIVGQFKLLLDIPGMLLRQQITLNELRPVGFVGMKDMTSFAVEMSQEAGHPAFIIQMLALISVALGMTNLLPIPALDGGRILFVLIEALRGRRVDPERETQVHFVGLALLLLLMLVVTYQDIFHPLIPR